MFLLCLCCPPLALIGIGKPKEFIISLPLCMMGYVPGIVYGMAVLMIHYEAKKRRVMGRHMGPHP